MELPDSVEHVIILIPNEAHERKNNPENFMADHNQYYIPTNLNISHGTSITFLNADTPWDEPHIHTINITDVSGNLVNTTGKLEYTDNSEQITLPARKYNIVNAEFYLDVTGRYNIVNAENESGKGTIVVRDEKKAKPHRVGSVIGGFYTPTNEIRNNKDKSGYLHPGWLGYYQTEFPKNGFRIMSQYNFQKYVSWPPELWYIEPREQTLIIYRTDQPLPNALVKLKKMVKDNAYVSDIRFEEVTSEQYRQRNWPGSGTNSF